jgi:hypothetical protein
MSDACLIHDPSYLISPTLCLISYTSPILSLMSNGRTVLLTQVRCCYKYCNKLFKERGFILKHLLNKHVGFAQDKMTANAEPFMRSRFNADSIAMRPLPPVEVESHGTVELKSVKGKKLRMNASMRLCNTCFTPMTGHRHPRAVLAPLPAHERQRTAPWRAVNT